MHRLTVPRVRVVAFTANLITEVFALLSPAFQHDFGQSATGISLLMSSFGITRRIAERRRLGQAGGELTLRDKFASSI